MDEYAFMLDMPAHKLLSLAIEAYWRRELNLSTREGELAAVKFLAVVTDGCIVEFVDFICNKLDSPSIILALTLMNDPEVTDGRNIDDFPDAQWLSIQNQLKSDLVGWLDE